MEFKALHILALTEEVAVRLEARLRSLPGVEQLTISLKTQELHIVFDKDQLDFRTLIQEMEKAGCPLQRISAALLFKQRSPGTAGMNEWVEIDGD
jgi:copper chaperone CopZ